ncbi:MAG: carboxypeptidase-like regulatory domain-containing protein, partial [Candidatus Diapherotrites archaeon]|nr:carboxypeptidase-like regulatory domain-containing protein [Candidatus Diapherotrites archaeon]
QSDVTIANGAATAISLTLTPIAPPACRSVGVGLPNGGASGTERCAKDGLICAQTDYGTCDQYVGVQGCKNCVVCCPQGTDLANQTVTVAVVGANGSAITAATVVAKDAAGNTIGTAQTDSQGKATLTLTQFTGYTLTASKDGFETQIVNIEVSSDASANNTGIVLPVRKVPFWVLVNGSADQQPLADATVVITVDSSTLSVGQTDSTGISGSILLEAGTHYKVDAIKSGFVSAHIEGDISLSSTGHSQTISLGH